MSKMTSPRSGLKLSLTDLETITENPINYDPFLIISYIFRSIHQCSGKIISFKLWGSNFLPSHVLKFVLTASIKNDLIKYIIHIFVWALHKSGDWTPFLEI